MTPGEADRYRSLVAHARRQGLDVIDALDRASGLVTDETVHTITMEALQALKEDLERWSATEYLRRIHKGPASTPADMYQAILGYVDDYVTRAKSQRSET